MIEQWPDDITSKLQDLYLNVYKADNDKLKDIAEKLGKSVPMVRAKLVCMKIYEKPEVPRKVGGASSVRKVHLVREIAAELGLKVDQVESLDKATKPVLELILKTLKGDSAK